MANTREPAKQCKTCPWRVGVKPERDIPNGYSRTMHEGLRNTIATDAGLRPGPVRAMACHYSAIGKERPCAGWLHNQLGEGNNLSVRLAVITGTLQPPEVEGEQHATFDDTLPKPRRIRSRR